MKNLATLILKYLLKIFIPLGVLKSSSIVPAKPSINPNYVSIPKTIIYNKFSYNKLKNFYKS